MARPMWSEVRESLTGDSRYANDRLGATINDGYTARKGVRLMTEAVTRMVAQLDDLSQEERADLAHAVLLSLEPEEEGVAEAWNRELARRFARIRNGEAVGIPAEQVFSDWRKDHA